jgi:hypothetical protein
MGTSALYRGGPDLAEPNSRIGFSSDHLLCSSAGHQFVKPSDLPARVDGGAPTVLLGALMISVGNLGLTIMAFLLEL